MLRQIKCFKVKAETHLESLDRERSEAWTQIEADISLIRKQIGARVDSVLTEYGELLKKKYLDMNRRLQMQLTHAKTAFQAEYDRIEMTEKSTCQAVIVALNAAFDEPGTFEKICTDYLKTYYTLKENFEKNEHLVCAKKLIETVEPWSGRPGSSRISLGI